MTDGIRKALILPGAGARGAYQVGVLKAVAEQLEPRAPCPFSVLSGTSAGAINAAVLASRAGNFGAAVRDMEQVWSGFSVDQVFRADALSMLKSSLHWLVAIVFGGLGRRNPVSLLDSRPLRELLTRSVRPDRIARRRRTRRTSCRRRRRARSPPRPRTANPPRSISLSAGASIFRADVAGISDCTKYVVK